MTAHPSCTLEFSVPIPEIVVDRTVVDQTFDPKVGAAAEVVGR